ncbi:LTA synthase family protein [Amaricoccus solimangrovi]|uniref:LTA synthase family protein n=1 Tax=Amaricoccus solimangrovi TaxID=2589815 RepID=A0A501WDA4_9RHOB|nr:LTA synthase family protein [Amaricoccus solimangrovi]TPE47569.1 LTA synthase family protein [Amaricoccus solimangrovi]
MTGSLAGIALLWLGLILPDRAAEIAPGALAVFPLELPPVLLGLMLLRGRALTAARLLLAAVLVALAALRGADIAAYAAFARPFNPALDGELIPAAARLSAGTIGTPLTLLLCLALAAAILGLGLALWWAAGRVARLGPARGRARAGLAALFLLALVPPALALAGRPAPLGDARATRLAAEHLRDTLAARADLARFRREAARDPYAATPPAAILPALAGHDIFVVFVESYGRTALENPLYRPATEARLAAAEGELARAGLAARSGWLTAPMIGGQSWFAHGTLLSGLRIDSQARYGALIASPRLTFPRLARRAGWRSVAVMPAITLAWPEARYFGYDTVLVAKDLGYRGEPFNWVTMPDQFTLASFERQALDPAPRPPVIAEIALISSHAPWTPIPPLIPWAEVGDGTVFDRWATTGESPEVLWRDPEKVRAQYGRAIDYALATTFSFAARRAGTAPLLIVLGDHQPAEFVSGGIGGQDVPVHVIGPPELVDRLAGWGWTPGLRPAAAVAPRPMAAFRDRFLAAFGPGS